MLSALLLPPIAEVIIAYGVWTPARGDRIDVRDDTKTWRVGQVLEIRHRTPTAAAVTATAAAAASVQPPPQSTAALAASVETTGSGGGGGGSGGGGGGFMKAIKSLFRRSSPAVNSNTCSGVSASNDSSQSADALIHFIGCDLLWDRWLPIDSPEIEPHGVHTNGKPTTPHHRTSHHNTSPPHSLPIPLFLTLSVLVCDLRWIECRCKYRYANSQ